ncbi:MAG: hypothetical protein AAB073_08040, partial [Pseudomonadota bacterium]
MSEKLRSCFHYVQYRESGFISDSVCKEKIINDSVCLVAGKNTNSPVHISQSNASSAHHTGKRII